MKTSSEMTVQNYTLFVSYAPNSKNLSANQMQICRGMKPLMNNAPMHIKILLSANELEYEYVGTAVHH